MAASLRPVRQTRHIQLQPRAQETLRHLMRPQAAEFGADDMRSWYRARDLLAGVRELVIAETSTLEDTVGFILSDTQLLARRSADRYRIS